MKFTVHILLKPGLENFGHYLTRVWDECNCAIVWTFFGIAFLWDWNENWPFQFCGHCWVFQICWHIDCSTFTAASFRIWKSSTGIPSPPLALFVVMLSKAHLTSHSRMSGSRSVVTPSWLSGSWRSFLYSSSVYSCHLFLISSASVRSKHNTVLNSFWIISILLLKSRHTILFFLNCYLTIPFPSLQESKLMAKKKVGGHNWHLWEYLWERNYQVCVWWAGGSQLAFVPET